jgi:hypothetical protein
VSLSVATLGTSKGAQAQSVEVPPLDPAPIVVTGATNHRLVAVPDHLSIGNQQFDASVAGVRAYLETTRSTDPKLYAQLAPDVDRLESRATVARIVLVTGLAAGAASTAYALLGGKDCVAPSVTDPAFSVGMAAWAACNRDEMRRVTTFTLIGIGSIIAGGIGWLALHPGRSDVFELVNKHNRLRPEPLRFQLGYDPVGRLAYGGASLSF